MIQELIEEINEQIIDNRIQYLSANDVSKTVVLTMQPIYRNRVKKYIMTKYPEYIKNIHLPAYSDRVVLFFHYDDEYAKFVGCIIPF
jgi:hypothetical protein